jgi:hypothetical protein
LTGCPAHPTLDRCLPLIHAAGASDAGDTVRSPITGIDLASPSMRAIIFG